jgi:small-conductance mechanosensitive channel
MNIFTFVQENAVIYGVKILVAIVIFFVGQMVAKGARAAVRQLMIRGKIDSTLVGFLGNLTYASVPVPADKDAFDFRDKMQRLVTSDNRVLQNPTPEVQVTGSSRSDAKLLLGFWVNSADYQLVNRNIQQQVLKEVA